MENQQAAQPQAQDPLENDGNHLQIARAELGHEQPSKPSTQCRRALGDPVSLSRTLHDVNSVYKEQDRWWEQLDGPTPTFL